MRSFGKLSSTTREPCEEWGRPVIETRRTCVLGTWAATVVALVTACSVATRTPMWVEIPAGYRGYLVVQMNASSCPPLERRDGYVLVRFDKDGRACTSDSQASQEGAARDRLFYVYEDGRRVELTYEEAGLGTMWGMGIHRMSGWVFAPPGFDSYVSQAIGSCQWEDLPCWRVLRQSGSYP